MSDSRIQRRMTMTTLVAPHHDASSSIGVLCQRLTHTIGTELSTKAIRLKYDFYGQETKEFLETYMMTEDLSQFDFLQHNHPAGLEAAKSGFVIFCAEREKRNADVWQIVLPTVKLNQISKNSKIGLRMQIFSICFDSDLQKMPLVFTAGHRTSENNDITFWTKFDAYLGYGIVEDHFSMTMSDYKAANGYDPIFEYAQKGYRDRLLDGAFGEEYSFEDYLKQKKDHFSAALELKILNSK